MNKLVSYKIPVTMEGKYTSDVKTEDRHGVICFVNIGNRKVKCVIQERWVIPRQSKSIERMLVHFATGQVLVYHADLKRKQKALWLAGQRNRLPWVTLAKYCLDDRVKNEGADSILAILDAAEVLNP